MRSFRKILIHALVVVLFLWGINGIGEFLYEPVRDNILVTSEELKDREGTIETLAMGTSLMHCGMDINVLNKELDTVGFNVATSAQAVSGTYYILKEQLKRNPIQRVFLGLGVNSFMSDTENRSTSAKTRVLKLLESPLTELRYLMDVAEPSELESLLFRPVRTKNVFSVRLVKNNVKYKLSDDFKNRVGHRSSPYTYFGMGYESNDKVYDGTPEKPRSNNVWRRGRILEENITYMKKMGELCRKNGVELNLVIFPHCQSYSAQQGDLEDMDVYLEELAEELGAGLYNYNYTSRPDIYEYLPDELYMDRKHLNQRGAAVFARLLAEDYKKAG
ncbi:MAG: hypothetical protein Q4D55_02360 [Eubacteriales bacterium]|nr:hypothetical protein [Eubacteriales bacterium]